jgi:hypothetical protein
MSSRSLQVQLSRGLSTEQKEQISVLGAALQQFLFDEGKV